MKENFQNSYKRFRLKNRYLINEGSTDETYHLELEAKDIPFTIGDSLAILPKNNLSFIKECASYFHSDTVLDKREKDINILEYLEDRVELFRIPTRIKSLYTSPNGSPINLLELAKSQTDRSPAILRELFPLKPRFYSICSAPNNSTIDLIVKIQYDKEGQMGTASRYLCQDLDIGESLTGYIQPAKHFRFPENGKVILIGAGTGIAPYRAFLQKALKTEKLHDTFLFFGEKRIKFDFYYKSFLEHCAEKFGLNLVTAFQEIKRTRYMFRID